MQRRHACVVAITAAVMVVVSGVALAADAPTFAGEPSRAPLAVAECRSVGPYRVPEPGSAGDPAGLRLCPSGPMIVNVPGAVVDGWNVRGGIVVDAPGVTIRRTRITGDGSRAYGIHTTAAGSVRVEDTTLTGDFLEAAVDGERWSGDRVAIIGVSHDGARLGSGSRLRNSIVRDVAAAPGVAADAVVLRVGAGPVLLEDNMIDYGDADDGGDAVLLVPDAPGRRGRGSVVVRGNTLGGGRWVLRQDPASEDRADILVTGNRFRRDGDRDPVRVSPGTVLTDNGYDDRGLLPVR